MGVKSFRSNLAHSGCPGRIFPTAIVINRMRVSSPTFPRVHILKPLNLRPNFFLFQVKTRLESNQAEAANEVAPVRLIGDRNGDGDVPFSQKMEACCN